VRLSAFGQQGTFRQTETCAEQASWRKTQSEIFTVIEEFNFDDLCQIQTADTLVEYPLNPHAEDQRFLAVVFAARTVQVEDLDQIGHQANPLVQIPIKAN
jgi:hypothetical protein